MKFWKFLLLVFVIIFSCSPPVLADDIDLEIPYTFNDLSSITVSSGTNTEPIINSKSAIIYDRVSGSVLFGKNENEKRKMASTTKIMTAIIVIENSNLNDIVTVSSKSAGTGGSRLGLHTNDKISVIDLLYGLLLCSGNDAAVALAEYVGGSLDDFAILMNEKCSVLNLSSTHFVTPHGLDNDEHFTSAYELAIITDYALKNETFRSLVGTKNHTISINGNSKNLSNTNELLGNLDGVYGVKTGFTNGANRCLVTSIKRNDMDLICVVLGADTKKDRTKDSISLIEYGFNNFEMINIKERIITEFNNWKSYNSSAFTIDKGISNDIDVYLADLPFDFFPVKCNQFDDVSIYIYCNTSFNAPLPSNSAIGYLTVSIGNNNVLSLDIFNSNTINRKNFNDFLFDMFKFYTYHLESILYKKI